MLGFRARIATIAISAAVALTSLTPSFAMPMMTAPVAASDKAVPADVQQVQWRHYGGYGGYRGGYYPRYYHGGGGWYGGYRGYPAYRHGYRYYDGYWYPLAAFGAGAIIGGAIASQPRYYAPAPAAGINPRHVEWCEARYRSYRAYDNTFQPNNGPRQQCYSPYY
ncbi:MAG: BA14K family protein [Rhizobiaceae bacterium]|nr:BA14K family protein [Rhizobiaceae bacterium]